MSWREVAASVLILTGVSFSLLGAVGLLRFPGIFPRMHAATKPLTLGLVSVLAGSALIMGNLGDVARLSLVAALQFITAPVAAHMVGRAAYRTYADARDALTVDELAETAE